MRVIRPAAALLLVALLAGCAPSAGDPLEVPTPASGAELTATGTVIDDGEGAKFCYAVMESYPPQCGGPLPLDGWDWEGLAAEEASGVRWGDFTVFGEYDGERLTLTRAPEPAGEREPWPSYTGPLTSDELANVQAQIERDLPEYLSIGSGDGFVHVDVLFDDGSLQAELDERYGEGAVTVTSLLTPA